MNIILFEGEPFFRRDDERFRHIQKILKKKPGDTFSAGIIDGPEGTAVITHMDDKGLRFDFHAERPVRPLYPVHLMIGFPRPIQLRRLLRDAASLGAASIHLTGTELGEKSYRASGLADPDVIRTCLIDGCMQAGFSAVPQCLLHGSVADFLDYTHKNIAGISSEHHHLLLDTVNPDFSLFNVPLGGISPEEPLVLAIGSERGWTSSERDLFHDAGFAVCSMGPRILRTETAACAALSIMLAKAGFMEGNT